MQTDVIGLVDNPSTDSSNIDMEFGITWEGESSMQCRYVPSLQLNRPLTVFNTTSPVGIQTPLPTKHILP
ncbi:hypothetical protein ABKN59_010413 [Abortiporus biennis]